MRVLPISKAKSAVIAHTEFDNKWCLCYNTCIDLTNGEIMNDFEFDEQTDFSFLGLEESALESTVIPGQRKDRSFLTGINLMDVRMSFPGRILSSAHKAKISAGMKRYHTSKKNFKI